MVTGTYIPIITLNVNGLTAPTKRHRLAEWVQTQDPYICCPQETHFRLMDTYRLKVSAWKQMFHANGNQKNTCSHTHIRQNRLQAKKGDKRQRWTVHNDKGDNSSIRHNSY